MSEELWSAVDAYIAAHLAPPDAVLDDVVQATRAAGLPDIAVTAAQGQLLHILARLVGARHVLELGTLAGYSTIWLARALPPGGRVITVEADARHADVARANFGRAGLSHMIDLRRGAALDVLPQLQQEGAGPFDMVFIDADKKSIPAYFQWALKLARLGSVIIVDNVVRKGAIIDADSTDDNVHGVRTLHEQLAQQHHVIATTMQTVGAKGYDGMTIALVNSS